MFGWKKRGTHLPAPAASKDVKIPEVAAQVTGAEMYRASYADLTLGAFIESCSVASVEEPFFSLFKDINLNDGSIAMSFREMWNLYRLAQKIGGIAGDVAELGVYNGRSAKLLCRVKGHKTLHLFDTFSGLPQVSPDIEDFEVGQIRGDTYDQVKGYLSEFSEVEIHPGMFPDTANPCKDKVFSLVNLDADTYLSTRDGLEFFYPRMSQSGVILAHDYRSPHCPGVRKAVDEFFADKPELPVELWDTQVVIVKH